MSIRATIQAARSHLVTKALTKQARAHSQESLPSWNHITWGKNGNSRRCSGWIRKNARRHRAITKYLKGWHIGDELDSVPGAPEIHMRNLCVGMSSSCAEELSSNSSHLRMEWLFWMVVSSLPPEIFRQEYLERCWAFPDKIKDARLNSSSK